MIRELQGLGFDVGIYTADKKEVELEKIDALVDDTEMLANVEAEDKQDNEAEINFDQEQVEEPAADDDLEMSILNNCLRNKKEKRRNV